MSHYDCIGKWWQILKMNNYNCVWLIFMHTVPPEPRDDGLLPFGVDFGDTIGPFSLDGASPPIRFSAPIFGTQEDTILVRTNSIMVIWQYVRSLKPNVVSSCSNDSPVCLNLRYCILCRSMQMESSHLEKAFLTSHLRPSHLPASVTISCLHCTGMTTMSGRMEPFTLESLTTSFFLVKWAAK